MRGEQSHWSCQMPRNLLNLKTKRKKNPPHPKKHKNKKPKVVKGKEYKIWQPKKRAAIRKCSLCSENFSSKKELNDHIAVHQKYKFLCSDRKCGKTFGSAQSLLKAQTPPWRNDIFVSSIWSKVPFCLRLV